MGNHSYAYLGPFLKCRFRHEPETAMIDACTNASCPNHQKKQRHTLEVRFCELCGSRIDKVEHTEQSAQPDHWYVSGQIKEKLFVAHNEERKERDFHFWLPNTSPGERGKLIHDRREATDVMLEPADIEKDRQWFRTEFSAELDVFKAAYGDTNVHLCWGWVEYWM